MSDAAEAPDVDYHLFLDGEERPVVGSALRLLINDAAHEPRIRQLAREVLAELAEAPDENGLLTVALSAEQMKVTHTAVKILFDDLQRDQAAEIEILRRVLNKLPDEHTIRAITLSNG
jgi:hypothetical protein